MQYRMHPSISCFPNSKFYFSQILDAPNVKARSYEKHYLPGPMFGPYTFINVFGGREELDDVGHSRKNMVEVAIVLKLLRSLYKGILCKNLKLLLPSCFGLFIYDYSRRLGIFLCKLMLTIVLLWHMRKLNDLACTTKLSLAVFSSCIKNTCMPV
jgi:hypothetical protein